MTGAENSGISGGSGPSGGENSDPTGEDIFLSLEDLPWRDNALDAYSAVINMPLRYTGYSEQKYAMGSSAGEFILGNTRASVNEYHYSEEEADRWYEIKAITDQGVETSFRVAIGENIGEKQSSYVSKVGSIAGSDHYMMMKVEAAGDTDADNGILYRFYETDEDMQVLNSFYVDGLDKNDYEHPLQLRVDKQGNLHIGAHHGGGGDTGDHFWSIYQC